MSNENDIPISNDTLISREIFIHFRHYSAFSQFLNATYPEDVSFLRGETNKRPPYLNKQLTWRVLVEKVDQWKSQGAKEEVEDTRHSLIEIAKEKQVKWAVTALSPEPAKAAVSFENLSERVGSILHFRGAAKAMFKPVFARIEWLQAVMTLTRLDSAQAKEAYAFLKSLKEEKPGQTIEPEQKQAITQNEEPTKPVAEDGPTKVVNPIRILPC